MAIRIDQLNPTNLVSRDHVVPAMREGLSVKLTIGQILDLLIDAAPGQLDTLNELAAALGDDPNFAATMAAALASKATLSGVEILSNKTLDAALLNSPRGEYLRGYLHALTLSNNVTDATNYIDIAAGSAASDGSIPVLMTIASALTKRMNAAWAVGSGNGGWLDGASMPNGTGHVFLIQRSDTGVVDVGASASLDPTLPPNYDRKRRIGAILRVSGAIVGFKQYGKRFVLNTPSTELSLTTTRANAPFALNIPSGVAMQAMISVRPISTSGNVLVVGGTGFECYSTTSGTYLSYRETVQTDASRQIDLSAGGTANGSSPWQIILLGWIDYTI